MSEGEGNGGFSAVADGLKYDSAGLIPAVIQDVENGDVLMVGYMNREAVIRTLQTGRVTFWSRSRGKFWVKGESSGNIQELVDLRADCDLDCLLVIARQSGPACHEGYRSCFFRRVGSDGLEVISQRMKSPEEMYGTG
jgi:phosphoribosyl-AMP cyclohydrolase